MGVTLLKNKISHKFSLFCVALLLSVIAWGMVFPGTALSQPLESRLNRLEVDRYSIEARLNRIEAQLNQVGRSRSPRVSSTSPQTPRNSGRNRPPQLSRDQMFDRLATLAIELKERITKLESRVSKLESRR